MTTDLTKGDRQPGSKSGKKSGAKSRKKSEKKSRSDPEKRVPYLLLVLCAVLAGWSFWTAGIFDGEIADDLRTSSVYAEPGFGLDVPAAEQAIGNRRLAAVFLDTEDVDAAREVCGDVERAADGVLVVVIFRDGAELDYYGCSWLYGDDDDAIGKNYVAESKITDGTSGFADRPLLVVKQMATNYDQLVRSDTVPGQAREIQASAPRYLLAFVALGAVVLGVGALYLVGRRAGRVATEQAETEIAELDANVRLQARLAGIAAAILRLDAHYPTSAQASQGSDQPVTRRGRRRRKRSEETPGRTQQWVEQYRSVCAEYTDLTTAAARADHDAGSEGLFDRAEALMRRVNELDSFGAASSSST